MQGERRLKGGYAKVALERLVHVSIRTSVVWTTCLLGSEILL